MRRACIFVIYDKQSTINPYVSEVVKELYRFTNDIFVVCNFERIISGEEYIAPYAKEIFYRENIGYDAGAYKDALDNYVTWDKVKDYDELILTNDTYFAPLYHFDSMFETMAELRCDYWGITRYPVWDENPESNFGEHIQSYFLCFKSNIIQDARFKAFWDEYSYADNKEAAIESFELGINFYLNKIGYKGAAYMDTKEYGVTFKNCNPYSKYAYELIKDGKVPIFKKTNTYGNNRWMVNAMKAMDYIEKNCDYDIKLITDYVEEYRKKGLIGPYYDFDEMKRFIKSHKRVYIYGAGVWGHITADYIMDQKLSFDGIVVTTAKRENEVEFQSLSITDDDGIIIAQEYKDVCDSIKEYIKDKVRDSQIFTPCYVDD